MMMADMEMMPMMAMESSVASADGGGAASPPSAMAVGGAPEAPVATVALPRSDIVARALFLPSVEVGPSGTATVPWTLPDNIGAFEIIGYAAAADGARFGGGATAEQLVRKDVSLVGSVPRIARVGDAFSCGVVVTAASLLQYS